MTTQTSALDPAYAPTGGPDFFAEHGFLHAPAVFGPAEVTELRVELDSLMQEWATNDAGWRGPWRHDYMAAETERRSKLVALHDLQYYSPAWARAIGHPRLVALLVELLGPLVEFHHSTLHVKPPQTGHPFPMHQDFPFYPHVDDRYVAVLVHLDDTRHENGEIRFVDGSHKDGPRNHITISSQGVCDPHLPTDIWRLEDTVAVPAQAGDVVFFNINTIHGSYINTTDEPRRLVRVGYRHPGNKQEAGQSLGRPGIMVAGTRPNPTSRGPFPQA